MGRGLSELQKSILKMARENRLEEGGPGPPPVRVIVLDNPGERDLRSLVPEGFARYPDGLWKRRTNRFYLVVESFDGHQTWEKRKHLVEDLSRRGLLAHESHARSYQCDLFSSDVLCRFYGFQERDLSAGEHPPGFPNARIVREWRGAYTDGANRNSARVAVARAFDRLAARGLAERRGAAINLTEQGLAMAESLSANGVDNISSISR